MRHRWRRYRNRGLRDQTGNGKPDAYMQTGYAIFCECRNKKFCERLIHRKYSLFGTRKSAMINQFALRELSGRSESAGLSRPPHLFGAWSTDARLSALLEDGPFATPHA